MTKPQKKSDCAGYPACRGPFGPCFDRPPLIRNMEEYSYPLKYQQTVDQYAAEYQMDPL